MKFLPFNSIIDAEDAAPPRTPPRLPFAVAVTVEPQSTTLADDELRALLFEALNPPESAP